MEVEQLTSTGADCPVLGIRRAMALSAAYDDFRAAVLNLIALRRRRVEALQAPDLQAELEDLEAEYQALVDTTTDADKAEIGEFYREALRVFGSNEEIFAQYPDVAGLLLTLRIEGARRQAMSSAATGRCGGRA